MKMRKFTIDNATFITISFHVLFHHEFDELSVFLQEEGDDESIRTIIVGCRSYMDFSLVILRLRRQNVLGRRFESFQITTTTHDSTFSYNKNTEFSLIQLSFVLGADHCSCFRSTRLRSKTMLLLFGLKSCTHLVIDI